MGITQLAVRRPILILMFFLGIFLFGLISIPRLSTDFLPEMEPPAVSVLVPYPGASAEDVENDVTRHLEDWLSTVEGLDYVTSLSKDNLSLVVCHFEWGVDLDEKVNDIRDKLDMAVSYIKEDAPDAESPIIFRFSSATAPVMFLTVSADTSWKELYRLVDKQISDRIKQIKGVGTVIMYGGLVRQIRVEFDWQKMAAYGVSPLEVARRLEEENIDLPLGDIKLGRRKYFLKLRGRFKDVEEIKGLIIGYSSDRPLYLKDIATVSDSFEEPIMKGWANGRPAIVLMIQKQTGANTVRVCGRIRDFIDSLRGRLPSDVKISIAMDNSEFILNAIRNLTNTLKVSALLVILVVLLFLKRKSSSFIIALSIPFSLILTFIFLYLNGFTINVISMMSLAIAIGMVVDNAIVVLENTVRHMEIEGLAAPEAAIKGVNEVFGAILASTLTTVSVFFPLIFVTGITGIIFHQLGSIVSMTLFASLIVSVTLTPSLAARMLGRKKDSSLSHIGDRIMGLVKGLYYPLLEYSLNKPIRLLSFMGVVFLLSLLLVRFIGSELFPVVDTGDIRISYSLPESTRLEETERITKQIMHRVEKLVPEARTYYSFIGETKRGIGVALGFDQGPNIGEVSIKLIDKEKRKRSAEEIAQVLRQALAQIPGIEKLSVIATTPTRQMIMGSGHQIEVEILGTQLDKIYDIAMRLKEKMEDIRGAVDVSISQKRPREELVITPDREKMARLGLDSRSLASILRSGYYGLTASKFRDAGDDFDIFLRLNETEKNDLNFIADMPIASMNGRPVLLKDIAQIKLQPGPVEINRKNRQRMISVGCNTFGRSMGEVKRDILKVIDSMDLPPGISIHLGGEVEEQKKAFSSMKQLLIVGIVLVYMVMAGQFESFKSPFIIFFSVPFAFVGVIIGLLLTHTPLSVMSFMGLIMIMGVVVNNAIVLVDYANQLSRRGLSPVDAVRQSARTRLRPIVMTSLTTVFGLLPLTMFRAQGAEMWRAFGVTTVSGLSLSFIVSLVIIPAVYVLMNRGSQAPYLYNSNN